MLGNNRGIDSLGFGDDRIEVSFIDAIGVYGQAWIISSEKGVEEAERGLALTLSCEHEAGDDTLGSGALWRASAEGNFAHDNGGAQRLFGLVTGIGDASRHLGI